MTRLPLAIAAAVALALSPLAASAQTAGVPQDKTGIPPAALALGAAALIGGGVAIALAANGGGGGGSSTTSTTGTTTPSN